MSTSTWATTWPVTEDATIASVPGQTGQFGDPVCMTDGVLLIGETDADYGTSSQAGAVHAYTRQNGQWTLEATIHAPDAQSNEFFGSGGVDFSGEYAIIGMPQDREGSDEWASARIFQRVSPGTWNQVADLNEVPPTGARMGTSVSISGTTATVLATNDDGVGGSVGRLYIYERQSAGNWLLTSIISAPEVNTYQHTFGPGSSVDIDGDTIMVGTRTDAVNGPSSLRAAVVVYTRDAQGQWSNTDVLSVYSVLNPVGSLGAAIDIEGNRAIIGAPNEGPMSGEAMGAAYIFERQNGAWVEIQHLIGSDLLLADVHFGGAVALEGDAVVIGAWGMQGGSPAASFAGSAYMFERDAAGLWTESSKGIASNETNDLHVGLSVDLDEMSVVAGSESGVYFYSAPDFDADGVPDYQDNCFLFNPDQADCNGNGVGDACDIETQYTHVRTESTPAQSSQLGAAIAAHGDLAVVGMPEPDGGSGEQALIMERQLNGSWANSVTLDSPYAPLSGRFGSSMDTDGELIIVGAPGHGYVNGLPNKMGGAFVYTKGSSDSWALQGELTASDAAAADYLGTSVALGNAQAFAGAPSHDDNADDSGAVYVFEHSGNTWTETQKLLASDGETSDQFGTSLAWSTVGTIEILAVGAEWGNSNSTATDPGCVYIFERPAGGSWVETTKLFASNAATWDHFGSAIDMHEGEIAIGAYRAASSQGSVYIFRRQSTGNWVETGIVNPDVVQNAKEFGRAVTFNDGRLIVGSPGDSLGQPNGGAIGSATVFLRGNDGNWTQESEVRSPIGLSYDRFGSAVAVADGMLLVGAPSSISGSNEPRVEFFSATSPLDCDDNDMLDECEIADGSGIDLDNSGTLDVCDCTADISGPTGGQADGQVDSADILWLVSQWGSPSPSGADLSQDGVVDVRDLLLMLHMYGPCP